MTDDLTTLQPLSTETPNAFKAFCDYIGMGSTRSLPKLAKHYNEQTEAVPTRQLSTLKAWSTRHEWKRRLNEYQRERILQAQQDRLEIYDDHLQRAIPMAETLLGNIARMMDDFQRLRTTRRQYVDDPRDAHLPVEQRRQIESIQMKVNTTDLQKLVATYGQLSKDLRTALGLPTVTEIQGVEPTVIKTYVGVSPEDWDNEPVPPIPERIEQPEADPIEEFPE